MIAHKELQKKISRRYIVADGYAGDTCEVGLAYHNGRAYEVSPHGYYPANGKKYESSNDCFEAFDDEKMRFTHFPQVIEVIS